MSTITVRAADLLREAASSDQTAIDFLVASAAFISRGRKEGDGDGVERIRRVLREVADTLSPLCPHCGKHIGVLPEQPETQEVKHE